MFQIGVVAHTRRLQQARRLADQVGATHLSVDDGTLGCNGNHLQTWKVMADRNTDWSLVLEDDAVPIEGFRDQLELALEVAPEPAVSLYLGTGRPQRWQKRIQQAIHRANRAGASWMIAPQLIHAVAVAIRTPLIRDMLNHVGDAPIDEAIGAWAGKVAYTWPSLVDHADGDALVNHRYDQPGSKPVRKAWQTGVRDTWTGISVPL